MFVYLAMKQLCWCKRGYGTEVGCEKKRDVNGTTLFALYVELYHTKARMTQQCQSLALSCQGSSSVC